MRKEILTVVFFITTVQLALSQFRNDKLITPVLKLSYQWQPEGDFETADDTWKYSALILDYRMPLIARMSKTGRAGSFGYKALMLNTGLRYSFPVIGSLDEQHKLIDAKLGIGFFLYGGGRNVLMGGGNANFFEDNYTIKDNIELRYNGFLNWHFKVFDFFGTNIGVTYTYKFGRALVLPLLGANFNFNKFNLRVALPLVLQASLVTSPKAKLVLFMMPDGSVNNFYNNGYDFPDKPEVVQMRQRKYLVGLGLDVFAMPHVRLIPELGLMLGQQIAFSDSPITSDDNFYDENIGSSIYLKITAAVVFGKPAGWGKGHATNFLLDKDIEDVLKIGE